MTAIEIYIGEPIEHASDRAVLEELISLLDQQHVPALIFANITVGGRQIDFVLVLEHLTLVIEAKGYLSAVRGAENGPWQIRVASSEWKNFPNPYLQVLKAKNLLRDAMRRFVGEEVPYPSAAVVFVPTIPTGSMIEAGDYKVSISGLDNLAVLLRAANSNPWSFSQWRAFATHHHLTRIAKMEAAFDPVLSEAEDALSSYIVAFRRTYGPLAAKHIEASCTDANGLCSSTEVIEKSAGGQTLLIKGPSGCGKSLLSFSIGLAAIENGRIPLFVFSKDFDGQLRDLVSHEAGLLDAPSGPSLIRAARLLDRPLVLIVDGYNECSETERARLTRAIAAASRRYEASLVITTQLPLQRSDLLQLEEISVPAPDDTLKATIARSAARTKVITTDMQTLLNTVGSGLEAQLVGEVAGMVNSGASRFALYDSYVRLRLGSMATEGIAALASIAGALADRVTFSLTVRDLDRHCGQERLSVDVLSRLYEARLLIATGEKVSFGHELFLNAFAAEAVVRKLRNRPPELVAALSLPRHAAQKELVVGAIDDETLLQGVLQEVVDPPLIEACQLGHCGDYAKRWAERRCKELLERISMEASQISFELTDKGWWGIGYLASSLVQWTKQDKAFFAVLGELAKDGLYFDDILSAVFTMDKRLALEYQRLRELPHEANVAIRSSLFANCYVGFGVAASGIASICGHIHSGSLHRKRHRTAAARAHDYLSKFNGSNGQLYTLLALHRHAWPNEQSLAHFLPNLLSRYWQRAEYHLRLDLLHAVQFCDPADEAERAALVEALEALPAPTHPFISTTLIEALQRHGALRQDEDDHVEVVRSNIRDVLSAPEDPDMQKLADRVWFAQFDHPYEGAYSQAISELNAEDKKALLVMAARGSGRYLMFVSILIMELASFADKSVGQWIVRWTAVPDTKANSPQEAMEVFAVCHIALARLGCPAPVPVASTPSEEALLACGRVLYWLNRVDLPMRERRSKCVDPLSTLMRHDLGVAAGVIRELYHAYFLHRDEGMSRLPGSEHVIASIGDAFPSEVAEICRKCLLSREVQKSYFQFPRMEKIFEFAVVSLGRWGNATDLPILRSLSNDVALGASAIAAIRKIEEASNQSSSTT